MNQPPVFLIYLAGPIDGISLEDASGWRDQLMADAPSGVLCFNPVTAWKGVSKLTAPAMDAGNRLIIRHCSGMVAKLDGPGRGFGTIREIEFASYHNIPVATSNSEGELESLLSYDLLQEDTPMDALSALMERVIEGQMRAAQHPLNRLFGTDG